MKVFKDKFDADTPDSPLNKFLEKFKNAIISEDAKASLEKILSDPKQEIVILSSNRIEYIRAILERALGKELLAKANIVIYDSSGPKSFGLEKTEAVKHHNAKAKPTKMNIMLGGSSPIQLAKMSAGIKNAEKKQVIQVPLGQFKYKDIVQKVDPTKVLDEKTSAVSSDVVPEQAPHVEASTEQAPTTVAAPEVSSHGLFAQPPLTRKKSIRVEEADISPPTSPKRQKSGENK